MVFQKFLKRKIIARSSIEVFRYIELGKLLISLKQHRRSTYFFVLNFDREI
jgi:hypothetical protein